MFTSGSFGAWISAVGASPDTLFSWWDMTEISSPVGTRHLESGHPAFLSYVNQTTPLQFRNLEKDFTNGLTPTYTTTEVITFRSNNQRFFLTNLRFWLSSGTAITSGHLTFAASGAWWPNVTNTSGYNPVISTSVPGSQNVYRQDGNSSIFSEGDPDVSQFIYLGLSIPSGHFMGRFGKGGFGNLSLKMTYDYFQYI